MKSIADLMLFIHVHTQFSYLRNNKSRQSFRNLWWWQYDISYKCKGQPIYIAIYKTIIKQLPKYIHTQFNYLSKIKSRQSLKNNDDSHAISLIYKCQSVYNEIYKIILNN